MKPQNQEIHRDMIEEQIPDLIDDMKDLGHPDRMAINDPDEKFHFTSEEDYKRFLSRRENAKVKPINFKHLLKKAEFIDGP